MAKVTLKFNRSRQYLHQKVLAGSVIEVDPFWARIFVADGTAVEVKPEAKKKRGSKRKS